MVAEAGRGGGDTAAVYHLRQGGLGAGEEWHSPTNVLDRFFMVGVEMAD